MFKFLLFALFLFLPFFVFAETYQDVGGFAQMVADEFFDIKSFIYDDVPSMLQRFTAYLFEAVIYVKYLIYKNSISFSWGVAKVIIEDMNIMSQITANMSLLPADVRQILVDMRLFDGVNLILNAFMTRFVMRLF